MEAGSDMASITGSDPIRRLGSACPFQDIFESRVSTRQLLGHNIA